MFIHQLPLACSQWSDFDDPQNIMIMAHIRSKNAYSYSDPVIIIFH